MMATTARWVRAAGLDGLELRLRARHSCSLWVLLAVAFVARAVVAAVFQDFDPATAEIWEYGDIARTTIEQGHGQMVWHPNGSTFVYPTAYEPPVLIWIWMGLFRLFGVSKLALATMTALNVLAGVGIVYFSIRV